MTFHLISVFSEPEECGYLLCCDSRAQDPTGEISFVKKGFTSDTYAAMGMGSALGIINQGKMVAPFHAALQNVGVGDLAMKAFCLAREEQLEYRLNSIADGVSYADAPVVRRLNPEKQQYFLTIAHRTPTDISLYVLSNTQPDMNIARRVHTIKYDPKELQQGAERNTLTWTTTPLLKQTGHLSELQLKLRTPSLQQAIGMFKQHFDTPASLHMVGQAPSYDPGAPQFYVVSNKRIECLRE
jgi:hypothetical protein